MLQKNTDEVQISSTAEKQEIFKTVVRKNCAVTIKAHTNNWADPSKGFRNILNASVAALIWKTSVK
jgi:hypothetical protein